MIFSCDAYEISWNFKGGGCKCLGMILASFTLTFELIFFFMPEKAGLDIEPKFVW